jgi:hypothetical protein
MSQIKAESDDFLGLPLELYLQPILLGFVSNSGLVGLIMKTQNWLISSSMTLSALEEQS